jgi:hypothetical protein
MSCVSKLFHTTHFSSPPNNAPKNVTRSCSQELVWTPLVFRSRRKECKAIGDPATPARDRQNEWNRRRSRATQWRVPTTPVGDHSTSAFISKHYLWLKPQRSPLYLPPSKTAPSWGPSCPPFSRPRRPRRPRRPLLRCWLLTHGTCMTSLPFSVVYHGPTSLFVFSCILGHSEVGKDPHGSLPSPLLC